LLGLLCQSVFGRLAGYDDVNNADRLAFDPVMPQGVRGRAVDAKAASTSQMGRFKTEVLATTANRIALADMSGQGIDRVHECKPPKWITLDMGSSVSPTHDAQQGTAWNGHFGCMCITRCSSSTSLSPSNAAPCAPEISTAPTDGKRS
jgi:hypothetical protein